MAKQVQREKRVIVRMTDEMYEKLEKYSEQHGQAPSAMASYAVSQWLVAQVRAEEQIRAIAEQVGAGVLDVAKAAIIAGGVDAEGLIKELGLEKKEEG